MNDKYKYGLTKAEIFRDWFNNFLSRERFAEYYEFSLEEADKVIEEGRVEHEEGVDMNE